MKRIFLYALFLLLLAFALPLLLFVPERDEPAAEEPAAPTPAAADSGAAAAVPEPVLDGAIPLRLQTEAGVETVTMAEYLPLAVAGEMPASFQPEALKAQAVALRSYALYYRDARKPAHPDADICTGAGCCAACAELAALREIWGENFDSYYARICDAVAATDGQYLVWEEAPALTVFHACSAGQTENGAALGIDRSYLVSVDTPETDEAVRNLSSTVEVSEGDFRAAVLSLAPEAELSGPKEGWLGQAVPDAAGRVATMEIGGCTLSGLALRQLFGLRSAAFTLECTEAGFIFHVRGYGHGVGMSQHGANLLAADGADYTAILRHYYPGTALVIAMRT